LKHIKLLYTMENQNNSRKRVGIGLTILAIGSILLMRNLGIYDHFLNTYILRWEMILISLGVINIFASGGRGPGYLLLLVGGGLYARDYIHLPQGLNFWQLFLACIFILAGIFMIFRRKGGCESSHYKHINISNDTIDELAFFGGGDRTIVSERFNGGKIMAVFGGSNFNLTRSKLAPGRNHIDLFAVFGGMKLVVPEDWNIKVNVVSIFGGISDKHRVHTPENYKEGDPILIIKGIVIFGGGEIKSY